MKILLTYFRLCTVLGLALLLSGCLISAQGNRGRVIIAEETPHPTVHKPGPPPHAKAHGHRAKYRYHYYPDAGVYFDTGRNLHFYIDSSGAWRMSASLPQSLRIRLGSNITIEMDTDRPYTRYHEHKKKYPPKKKKKSNHRQVINAKQTRPPAPVYKSGPPAHAKAQLHRAKYRYHYYPDAGVYFDTGRKLHFYIDSSGAWRMSVSLPKSLKVRLGSNVTIDMDTDRPYTKHQAHKKKYPPKKNIKKKWK